jgi:UDP-2-acetamido-3-amino-2,3-dideoxy-glucuronate N-acetyltransferase
MIHPNAIVNSNAKIGSGVTIWQNTQVREMVSIGKNTIIGANCYIGPGVKIGEYCKIQNNVLIYEPASIGDFVFVGPGVIFTNDKRPRAYNNDFSPRSKQDWEKNQILVENNVSIGASSTCVAPITLRAFSLIGAGSLVLKSTYANSLNFGHPSKFISWLDDFGDELIKLPNGDLQSINDETIYVIEDDTLTRKLKFN